MEQYNVTGMSCAACQARVEKAVSAVPGVTSCAVSLLTNSMGVEGSASSVDVIKAVTDAGYGASLKGQQQTSQAGYDDALKDTETPKMKRRLIASVIILLPLMYVSMGHMMWDWPLPGFLSGNHIAMGLYEMLLTIAIMVINQKFFVSGFKGLVHGSPNMDTLVALGATASFGYSVYVLFAMTAAQVAGDSARVMDLMMEFYFESAAMILTLITVGKMLEAMSKGRTTDALKSLMKLAPQTATLVKNGAEVTVEIAAVQAGDIFVVRPGESIPVDGVVIDGSTAVNESALTGESIPVDKAPGDAVSAATINESGFITCRATRVGQDTTLSQIIAMVSDAAATKAPIAKVADRVSGIFVPAVITIAIITFIIWMLVGQTLGYALARAISVLVISCPCALGLATPVAIMVGNGVGAKHGILFKTAVSLEETGKTQIICLDKTGTITEGKPMVTGLYPAYGIEESQLLTLAASLEKSSEHPLARAISQYATEQDISIETVTDFKALPGNGIEATIDGQKAYAGSQLFIKEKLTLSDDMMLKADSLAAKGMTPLFFAKSGKLYGMIAVADVIKADSKDAIDQLKAMGIHVIMLTGDNELTARAIASQAGVDEVVASVKPDGKAAVVQQLKNKGKVVMVGDGINDAPALTSADIGIAIGAGTDVAIDAADVVVMKSKLSDVAASIRISRATLRNIHENLFWAFFYNVIGIPLAAGAYIHAFGWTLNPMFGAAAMSLSSFCVVSNALRLNLCKLYDNGHDKIIKNTLGHEPLLTKASPEVNKKEDNTMEITVKGMMCPHCEAHVKEALEKLSGIEEARANHAENLVSITTSAEVAEADIKTAVEGAGYEYVGIKEAN